MADVSPQPAGRLDARRWRRGAGRRRGGDHGDRVVWLRVGPLPARPARSTSRAAVDDRRRSPRRATVRSAVGRAALRGDRLSADALPRPCSCTRRWPPKTRGFACAPRRRSDRDRARGVAQRPRRAASSRADRRSRSRSRSCCSRVRPGARAARAAGAPRSREAVIALRLEHRLTQERDPRAVPEPGAVRQPDRGRRARRARVLRPQRGQR